MPATPHKATCVPRLLAWGAFAYALLGLVVMIHYGSRYFADPRANEMGIGFMIGFMYSSPAWLALPVYVIARWKRLPAWERFVLCALPSWPWGACALLTAKAP